MIVIDASTLVEVLLRTSAAGRIEARIFAAGETMHAPHLLDIEVAQVIRRWAMRGDIAMDQGGEAMRDLADWPVARYPHGLLLPRIWALRHNLTAYDASYVALAEVLGGVLLTRDARLAAASGHQARIEVI